MTKVYYRSNAPRLKANVKAYQTTNPDVNRRASAKWRANNPKRRMLMAAKYRAVAKGIGFLITTDDFDIPSACPIFGTPLLTTAGRGRAGLDDSPSLDRVDPTLGYVPGNIAVISGRANKIKNAGSAAEHRRIADWIDHFTGKALPK